MKRTVLIVLLLVGTSITYWWVTFQSKRTDTEPSTSVADFDFASSSGDLGNEPSQAINEQIQGSNDAYGHSGNVALPLVSAPDYSSPGYADALSSATSLLDKKQDVVRHRMMRIEHNAVQSMYEAVKNESVDLNYSVPFFDDVTCTVKFIKMIRERQSGSDLVLTAQCIEYRDLTVVLNADQGTTKGTLSLSGVSYQMNAVGHGYVLMTEVTPRF